MDGAKRKRVPCHDPHRPAPLVQTLPDQMARIDPTVVPQLTCYVLALRERYERDAKLTCAGLTGKARKIRQGRIAWAQCMVQAIDALARTFYETIDLRAYDRAQREYHAALASHSSPE